MTPRKEMLSDLGSRAAIRKDDFRLGVNLGFKCSYPGGEIISFFLKPCFDQQNRLSRIAFKERQESDTYRSKELSRTSFFMQI